MKWKISAVIMIITFLNNIFFTSNLEKYKLISLCGNQYVSTNDEGKIFYFDIKYKQYIDNYVISQCLLLEQENIQILDYITFQDKYLIILSSLQYIDIYYVTYNDEYLPISGTRRYSCKKIQQMKLPGYNSLGINSFYYFYVIENKIFTYGYYTDVVELACDGDCQSIFKCSIITNTSIDITISLCKVLEGGICKLTVTPSGILLKSLSGPFFIQLASNLNIKISHLRSWLNGFVFLQNNEVFHLSGVQKTQIFDLRQKIKSFCVHKEQLVILYEKKIVAYDVAGNIIFDVFFFLFPSEILPDKSCTFPVGKLVETQKKLIFPHRFTPRIAQGATESLGMTVNSEKVQRHSLNDTKTSENNIKSSQDIAVQAFFILQQKMEKKSVHLDKKDENNNQQQFISFINGVKMQESSFDSEKQQIQSKQDENHIIGQDNEYLNDLIMIIIDSLGNIYINQPYDKKENSFYFHQIITSQLDYNKMICVAENIFLGLQQHKITIYSVIKQFQLQNIINLQFLQSNLDEENYYNYASNIIQILNFKDNTSQLSVLKTHPLMFTYQKDIYYIHEQNSNNNIIRITQKIETVASIDTMLQQLYSSNETLNYYIMDLIQDNSDQYFIILYNIQECSYMYLNFIFVLSEITPQKLFKVACNISAEKYIYDRGAKVCFTDNLSQIYNIQTSQLVDCQNQQSIQQVSFNKVANLYKDSHITITNNIITSNKYNSNRTTNGLIISVEKYKSDEMSCQYILYTSTKALYIVACSDILQLILVNSRCIGYRVTNSQIFFIQQGLNCILSIDTYTLNNDNLQSIYQQCTNFYLSEAQYDEDTFSFQNIPITELEQNIFIHNQSIFIALQGIKQIQHAQIYDKSINMLKRIKKMQFQLSNDLYLLLKVNSNQNEINWTLQCKNVQIQRISSLLNLKDETFDLSNIITLKQNYLQIVAVNFCNTYLSSSNNKLNERKLYLLQYQDQNIEHVRGISIKQQQLRKDTLKQILLYESYHNYYLLMVFTRTGIQLYQLNIQNDLHYAENNEAEPQQLNNIKDSQVSSHFISETPINMYISSLSLINNQLQIFDKFGQFAILHPHSLEIIKWGNLPKIIVDQHTYTGFDKHETKILIDTTGQVIQNAYL